MRKVKSKDGTPIAYWRTGSGSPLLLVHGTTADHTRWPSIISDFENYFTVYAIDRRGRGESGDTEPYSIDRESEDIIAVINSINEPVNVLGHSYGALCCLEAALLTDNIKKLILYEPYFRTDGDGNSNEIADRIQKMVDEGDRDGAVSLMFLEIAKMPKEELEELRSLPSWNLRVAMAHTIARETREEESYRFLPGKFKKLNIPVLMMLGGSSPKPMKNTTEMVNNALPNSQIAVLPDQQHIAMNTAPELFKREVFKFLFE